MQNGRVARGAPRIGCPGAVRGVVIPRVQSSVFHPLTAVSARAALHAVAVRTPPPAAPVGRLVRHHNLAAAAAADRESGRPIAVPAPRYRALKAVRNRLRVFGTAPIDCDVAAGAARAALEGVPTALRALSAVRVARDIAGRPQEPPGRAVSGRAVAALVAEPVLAVANYCDRPVVGIDLLPARVAPTVVSARLAVLHKHITPLTTWYPER